MEWVFGLTSHLKQSSKGSGNMANGSNGWANKKKLMFQDMETK